MATLLLPLLAAATPATGLAILDPVAGRCWEGAVAEDARDVHCFEPVYGGAHVRDRHRVYVEGRVVYEGETLYSREGERVTFVYLNSLGGAGHGTATASDDGVCFTLAMRGSPDADTEQQATCWHWLAPDGYLVQQPNGATIRFGPSATRF